MSKWNYTVKIKHLFTENEDFESVQESMNAIADVLDNTFFVPRFNTAKFRNMPKDNEYIEPLEYANKLLNEWYDFADEYRIWTA